MWLYGESQKIRQCFMIPSPASTMKHYKHYQTNISASWSWDTTRPWNNSSAGLTGQIRRMPTAALAHIELPIQRWEALNRGYSRNLSQLMDTQNAFHRLSQLLISGDASPACGLSARSARPSFGRNPGLDSQRWAIPPMGRGRW